MALNPYKDSTLQVNTDSSVANSEESFMPFRLREYSLYARRLQVTLAWRLEVRSHPEKSWNGGVTVVATLHPPYATFEFPVASGPGWVPTSLHSLHSPVLPSSCSLPVAGQLLLVLLQSTARQTDHQLHVSPKCIAAAAAHHNAPNRTIMHQTIQHYTLADGVHHRPP